MSSPLSAKLRHPTVDFACNPRSTQLWIAGCAAIHSANARIPKPKHNPAPHRRRPIRRGSRLLDLHPRQSLSRPIPELFRTGKAGRPPRQNQPSTVLCRHPDFPTMSYRKLRPTASTTALRRLQHLTISMSDPSTLTRKAACATQLSASRTPDWLHTPLRTVDPFHRFQLPQQQRPLPKEITASSATPFPIAMQFPANQGAFPVIDSPPTANLQNP